MDVELRREISDVYLANRSALLKYLRVKYRVRDLAHDLAQEAYLQMLALKERPRHLQAYLFQTAANITINHLNAAANRRRLRDLYVQEPVGSVSFITPEGIARDRETVQAIMQLLSRLPQEKVRVFVWIAFHGRTLQEAAQIEQIHERSARRYFAWVLSRCVALVAREEELGAVPAKGESLAPMSSSSRARR